MCNLQKSWLTRGHFDQGTQIHKLHSQNCNGLSISPFDLFSVNSHSKLFFLPCEEDMVSLLTSLIASDILDEVLPIGSIRIGIM